LSSLLRNALDETTNRPDQARGSADEMCAGADELNFRRLGSRRAITLNADAQRK
jgi:hypothetical protein